MIPQISLNLSPTEYSDECAITLDSFEKLAEKNNLIATGCGHKFSQTAMKEWLTKNPTCPTCQRVVTTDEFTPVTLKIDEIAKNAIEAALAPKPDAEKPVEAEKPAPVTTPAPQEASSKEETPKPSEPEKPVPVTTPAPQESSSSTRVNGHFLDYIRSKCSNIWRPGRRYNVGMM